VFASSGGQHVGPVTNNGDGTYTATITSTKTAGRATITATDSSASGNPSGAATLTQVAGPAASTALVLEPASLVADGLSQSSATVTVTDANGNRVVGDPVAVASSGGQPVGPVVDHGDGTYTARITATTAAGSATITASDGPAAGTATLTQTPLPAAKVLPDTLLTDSNFAQFRVRWLRRVGGDHRAAVVTLACASSVPCQLSGTVEATTKRHGKARRVVLDHVWAVVAPGKIRAITLHLNRSGYALLRKNRRVASTLVLAAKDRHGHARTQTAKHTLRARTARHRTT
jgi:hypothetical protein